MTDKKAEKKGKIQTINLNNKDIFGMMFLDKLEVLRGLSISDASVEDCYVALATLIRDQIMKQWIKSGARTYKHDEKKKQVYYFSLEFLLGPCSRGISFHLDF